MYKTLERYWSIYLSFFFFKYFRKESSEIFISIVLMEWGFRTNTLQYSFNRWLKLLCKKYFITFFFKINVKSPISLNNNQIPIPPIIKYLGLTFDRCLTWAQLLKNKRKTVNSRLHLLHLLLQSKTAIGNKLFIYKSSIRPVWSYDIQIWSSIKSSNMRTIQAFQSICLWQIVCSMVHQQ